jgi:hypothetical protein
MIRLQSRHPVPRQILSRQTLPQPSFSDDLVECPRQPAARQLRQLR